MKFLTYSGDIVDLESKPKLVPINLTAIVQSMVKVCRFNGNTKYHYSNLQHQLSVAAIVPREMRYAALLHDVHEHLMGDIITPVAAIMGRKKLSCLKDELDRYIGAYFDCPELVDPSLKKELKYFDDQMTKIEAYALIKNAKILFEKPEIKFDIKEFSNKTIVKQYRKALKECNNG